MKGLDRLDEWCIELGKLGLIGLHLVSLGLVVGYGYGLVSKGETRTIVSEVVRITTIKASSWLVWWIGCIPVLTILGKGPLLAWLVRLGSWCGSACGVKMTKSVANGAIATKRVLWVMKFALVA